MLIFNANQLNSLQEIFVTVLILYPTLIFLAFRAYLLEPPPQDYITKGKTMKKSQNSNEVKNGCTGSRIRIVETYSNKILNQFTYSLLIYLFVHFLSSIIKKQQQTILNCPR